VTLAGAQLNAPDAGLAFGADDVAFSHGVIMRGLVDRSKTEAVARILLKPGERAGLPSFADGTLFSVGELRSPKEQWKINHLTQPAGLVLR
jgi:hypothetical protein